MKLFKKCLQTEIQVKIWQNLRKSFHLKFIDFFCKKKECMTIFSPYICVKFHTQKKICVKFFSIILICWENLIDALLVNIIVKKTKNKEIGKIKKT
jgi:hypothetical protein